MKKTLFFLLASVMLLTCVFSVSASADDPRFVTDGLEAFYHAAENDDATVWNDLSGNNNNIVDLPNTDSCKFVDGAYLNTNTKIFFPQGVVDVINEKDAWTTEFLFGDVNVTGAMWGTLVNSTNDHYSLYYLVSGSSFWLKNNGPSSANDRPNATLENGFSDLSGKMVTVTFQKGVSCNIYLDGELFASAVPAAAIDVADFFFGHDDANKTHTTEYVSMRFYNRALTEDEIAQNLEAEGAVESDPVVPDEPITPDTGDVGMIFILVALFALGGTVVVSKAKR